MPSHDAVVVEEVSLDQWLIAAFVSAKRAVPKSTCCARRRSKQSVRAYPGLAGARPLFWIWLAGASLAFALQ